MEVEQRATKRRVASSEGASGPRVGADDRQRALQAKTLLEEPRRAGTMVQDAAG